MFFLNINWWILNNVSVQLVPTSFCTCGLPTYCLTFSLSCLLTLHPLFPAVSFSTFPLIPSKDRRARRTPNNGRPAQISRPLGEAAVSKTSLYPPYCHPHPQSTGHHVETLDIIMGDRRRLLFDDQPPPLCPTTRCPGHEAHPYR